MARITFSADPQTVKQLRKLLANPYFMGPTWAAAASDDEIVHAAEASMETMAGAATQVRVALQPIADAFHAFAERVAAIRDRNPDLHEQLSCLAAPHSRTAWTGPRAP